MTIDPASVEPITIEADAWYGFSHGLVVYAEGLAAPHAPPHQIALLANISVNGPGGLTDFQSTQEQCGDWGQGHQRPGVLIAQFQQDGMGLHQLRFQLAEPILPSALAQDRPRLAVYAGVCGCEQLVAAVAALAMAAQSLVAAAFFFATCLTWLRRPSRA